MSEFRITESYYRLLNIIWETEPIPLRKFVKIAEERLGWTRSTIITVLNKLAANGYCVNEERVVKALIMREAVEQADSEEIVSKRFGGSLPHFVESYISSGRLEDKDADEIIEMLKNYKNRQSV